MGCYHRKDRIFSQHWTRSLQQRRKIKKALNKKNRIAMRQMSNVNDLESSTFIVNNFKIYFSGRKKFSQFFHRRDYRYGGVQQA